MKYHALFVIFEKSGKIFNWRLLQIIGDALRIKTYPDKRKLSLFLHILSESDQSCIKNIAKTLKYHFLTRNVFI